MTTLAKTIADLPFPEKFGMENKVEVTLANPCWLSDIEGKDTIEIPAGTKIQLSTHENYGLVVLPQGYSKRLWRY